MAELLVRHVRPRSNIYTVLAVVAVAALLVGIGYMIARNRALTEQGNPFLVVERTSDAVR